MNKTELVAALAAKTELSKKDAEKALNAVVETITEALKAGDKVALVGFGTFEAKERPAREEIKVEASKTPAFKAGKALKDAVNG